MPSLSRSILVPAMITSLFAATLVSDLPAASGSSTVLEIPFEHSPRGHIMIPVRIDGGEPLPFVVDTGAGMSVLNRARLDRLGLEERQSGEEVQRAHGTASLGRAEASDVSVDETSFGRMELGVMTLTGVEAGQFEIYGILGYDVLSRHDIAIDFEARTLSLHPKAATIDECAVCDGEVSTDFELAVGTHIRFDVEISGQSIAAVLDTGSGRTGMNPLAAESIGVEIPDSVPGGHGFGLSVGEIRMGDGILAQDTPVGVIDLPVFAALCMGDGPALLLGSGTLAGRRVGISYGLNRISVR